MYKFVLSEMLSYYLLMQQTVQGSYIHSLIDQPCAVQASGHIHSHQHQQVRVRHLTTEDIIEIMASAQCIYIRNNNAGK